MGKKVRNMFAWQQQEIQTQFAETRGKIARSKNFAKSQQQWFRRLTFQLQVSFKKLNLSIQLTAYQKMIRFLERIDVMKEIMST